MKVPLGRRRTPECAGTMPPVFGFVGGFIKDGDPVRGEARLAARLRKAYPSGVDVEFFENYHEENARKKIPAMLETNLHEILTHGEKQNTRIIPHAHGWRGS